jgi:ATP-dependent RNA helicase DBP3
MGDPGSEKRLRKEAKRRRKAEKMENQKEEEEVGDTTREKQQQRKKAKKSKKKKDKKDTLPTCTSSNSKEDAVHVDGMDDLAPLPDSDLEDGCARIGMSSKVIAYLSQKGFSRATPIQRYCWPALLAGRDVVGVSETGSGKTLAFSLPGLERILKQRCTSAAGSSVSSPQMLVLAPTRELAIQSFEVLAEAGRLCQCKAACVYGGIPKAPQRREASGAHAIVATPGRLKDLVEEGSVSLHNVQYLVLDEADRLLDLGFEPDIRWLVGKSSSKRQTAMLSATWPEEIQKLASDFLRQPVVMSVGRGQEGAGNVRLRANARVTLHVEVIEERARDPRLLELLQKLLPHSEGGGQGGGARVMVFALYKKDAVRLESMLSRKGYKVCSVHGDKGQREREEALANFRSNRVSLMVATDVAARGLDIPHVEAVLNYQFPLTAEDYIHRVGRTGRAGATGVTYTFFTHHDKARAGELIQILRDANQVIPPDLTKFGSHVKKKEHKLYGGFHRQPVPGKSATKITFESDDEE